MKVFCGILASGSGERYSSKNNPKQLETLAGSSLFAITLKTAQKSQLFDGIVISIIQGLEERFTESISNEVRDQTYSDIHTTLGGKTRMQSMLNVINKFREIYSIEKDDILVLCDANRPLVTKEYFISLIEEAKIHKISCPSRPLVDGIGIVNDGFLTEIPDKSMIHTIQTPEACNFEILIKFIDQNKHNNRLGLSEIFLGAGIKPKVIESDHKTHKVTYPGDIDILEVLMDLDNEKL